MTVAIRRHIIRDLCAVAYIALAVLIFINNRGHSLLVDNKAVDGESAIELMKVSVDDGQGLEFLAGDRDRFAVAGANHKIRVEFFDGRPVFETTIRLPLKPDIFLLSIPKLLAGKEPAFEVFVQARDPLPSQNETPPTADEIFGPAAGTL